MSNGRSGREVFVPTVEYTEELIQTTTQLPRRDEGTSIDFKISAREGYLVSPKMRILDQIQVVKVDANNRVYPLDEDDNTCLVNFAGMTKYKMIEVYLGEALVSRSNYNHGVVAYIRALTEYKHYEKRNKLSLAGWEPDEGLELINEKRAELTKRAKIEMMSPLLTDVFNHNQPYPDDLDITIKCHRAPVPWVLNGAPQEGYTYQIVFLKSELEITRLKMPDGMDIYKEVGGGGMIQYNYPYYEPRHFIEPANITSVNEEILDKETMPDQIIVLYQNQDAFSGAHGYNPLQFNDMLTREVKLRIDELHD